MFDILTQILIALQPYGLQADLVFTRDKEIVLYCAIVRGDVEKFWSDPHSVLPANVQKSWILDDAIYELARREAPRRLILNLPFYDIFENAGEMAPSSLNACFLFTLFDHLSHPEKEITERTNAVLSHLSSLWSTKGVVITSPCDDLL